MPPSSEDTESRLDFGKDIFLRALTFATLAVGLAIGFYGDAPEARYLFYAYLVISIPLARWFIAHRDRVWRTNLAATTCSGNSASAPPPSEPETNQEPTGSTDLFLLLLILALLGAGEAAGRASDEHPLLVRFCVPALWLLAFASTSYFFAQKERKARA